MKLNVEGCHINYEHIVHPKASATIVFIHGWGDSMEDTNENVPELATTFNTLRFDLPGHGQSDSLPRYSIPAYVKYTKATISRLGIERPSLVGHSMGAVVATQLHRADASAFQRIVLLDPPLKKSAPLGRLILPSLWLAEAIGGWAAILDLVMRDRRFQNFWCDLFIGPARPEVLEARRITIDGMLRADLPAVVQGTFDTLTNAMMAKPPRKSAAFYVIYGQLDPVIDREAVADLFMHDHIVEIPNERHTPNRTSPAVFNAILRDMIV